MGNKNIQPTMNIQSAMDDAKRKAGLTVKKTLTVMETADYLGVGRRTAYELVNSQGFPSFRIGTKILVSVAGLEEWIQKNIAERWEVG